MQDNPNPSIHEKPPIYPESIQELLAQIKGDPNCHRADCYGRGFRGVEFKADGGKRAIMCRCGHFTDTEYVMLVNRIDKALTVWATALANRTDHMNRQIEEIQRTLILLRIRRWILRVYHFVLEKTSRLRAKRSASKIKTEKTPELAPAEAKAS